nr:hypothetical protein BaRGS_023545 [Batillaria attramentaria]
MMAYFTALIMMTMVIATCLTSVQGECLKGDDCSSAAITCKLAGTVYCCGGAGSTVNASAVNGQLKFCTCVVWCGVVWNPIAWRRMVWIGMASHRMVWYGLARHGTARHGTARHGTARHGTARHQIV